MMKLKYGIFWMAILWIGIACSSDEPQGAVTLPKEAIRVGGVQTTNELLVATRAGEASEIVQWLIPSLTSGLNITYWYVNNPNDQKVALLKYDTQTKQYSFNYKNATNSPALWLDNGFHGFKGDCLPEALYGAILPENLTTNQSNDSKEDGALGNYTLLERYLSMPPDCKIAATLNFIRLPFQHRLARVLAYVLIDPTLGNGVKIKGYDTAGEPLRDDPNTSSIRFAEVNVLEKVTTGTDPVLQIPTYTPSWTTAKKVVPHFVGEMGSESHRGIEGRPDKFYVYVKGEEERVYPSEEKWQTIHQAYEADPEYCEYTREDFGSVPCYDLIVQPEVNNRIRFEMELNNGLRYEKTFEFYLKSNQQTVVYLHISREKVDYDNSGSELWVESSSHDDYYGVNNANGNSLSMAGSSWQRAYRIGTDGPNDVTDGSNYNEDNEEDHGNGDGQYLSEGNWIKAFCQATEKDANGNTKAGAHHGDYFILTGDLTIDVSKLPENFVFTGHLDGRGHTITLTGTRSSSEGEGASPILYLFDGLNGTYGGSKGEANLHEEKGQLVPVMGYRAEVMNLTVRDGRLFRESATFSQGKTTGSFDVTGSVLNCRDNSGAVINEVGIPTVGTNP